jgi:hypothetical protein
MRGTSVEGESPNRADSFALHDPDEVLVQDTREIESDWPKYLPARRIKAGLLEIALGFLLFAALLAFCGLH